MIQQFQITLPEFRRGYHLITHLIKKALPELPEAGIAHIFIKHTSAGLTLNENADPSVRKDFETTMNHLIPENQKFYTHTLEGSDDMPAHLKSSIIGNSVTIPVSNGQFNLGTWQGIYLCEFRNYSENRNIVITIIS